MNEIKDKLNWHLSELQRYVDMIPLGVLSGTRISEPVVPTEPQYLTFDIERAERTAFATNDTGGVVAEYIVGQPYFIWIETVDTLGVHINDQDLPYGIRNGGVNTGDDERFDRREGTYNVYRYTPSATSLDTSIFTVGVYLDSTTSDSNALLANFSLPIVGSSVSIPPASSPVHNGFGTLTTFSPAIIRSPNEPWSFTSSQNGQTINDFEMIYTGNNVQNPVRFFGSDSNPVKDITFNGGIVAVPQNSRWRNNNIATCPIFGFKTSNIKFNDVVVVGGRAGIMMQQGHRTTLDRCISVEPWRHGFQIDDDEPLDGDMGHIKKSLVYTLTRERAESLGLEMSTGADMVNITKPNYNGGNSYLVEDVVVVGSHGQNGTQFIQDKGQPSSNAGGTIFRRCRALLGNNLPLTDAGNRGIRSEDFIAYSPSDGPVSGWTDESNSHSFNWFDFGRVVGDQFDSIARSPDRSGGSHNGYRAHIVNSGGLRRDNYFPPAGEADRFGENQDVFYAHPVSSLPTITNSNFSDTSLTLEEAWNAAKVSLSDLPVFEHELFNRNDWSDWVAAQ